MRITYYYLEAYLFSIIFLVELLLLLACMSNLCMRAVILEFETDELSSGGCPPITNTCNYVLNEIDAALVCHLTHTNTAVGRDLVSKVAIA